MIRETFENLINNLQDGQYSSRLIKFDEVSNKYRVFLALDRDNNYQKIILIQTIDGNLEISNAIDNINLINSFSISSFPSNDTDLPVFYSIKLSEEAEDEIFFSFIEDLISQITSENDIKPMLSVIKRIKSWMNFFKSKNIRRRRWRGRVAAEGNSPRAWSRRTARGWLRRHQRRYGIERAGRMTVRCLPAWSCCTRVRCRW